MALDQPKTDWQVPRFQASAESRYEWVEDAAIREGEGFLEGQSAYKNLAKNLAIFDGVLDDKVNSTLISNGLKYDIRKFIETISEVREIGTYGSDAKQFKSYAGMLTKVVKAVYMEAQFPAAVRKALQFASVMGRGYIWPKCKTMNYGYGERRIIFEPLGLLDVVPVQMPATNDVQDSYAVTVYEYMPIAEAHARFPLQQASLFPVSNVDYSSRIQARRADYAERFRYGGEQRNWGNLFCEIRYTFVRDISINNTRTEIPMGDWGKNSDGKWVPITSWSYEVPYIGKDIFGGYRNGAPFMRPATQEDCLMYPHLDYLQQAPAWKFRCTTDPPTTFTGSFPRCNTMWTTGLGKRLEDHWCKT